MATGVSIVICTGVSNAMLIGFSDVMATGVSIVICTGVSNVIGTGFSVIFVEAGTVVVVISVSFVVLAVDSTGLIVVFEVDSTGQVAVYSTAESWAFLHALKVDRQLFFITFTASASFRALH